MKKFKTIAEAFTTAFSPENDLEKPIENSEIEKVKEPDVTEPDTQLEEPVEQVNNDIDKEIMKNAYTDTINNLINSSWDFISQLNSVISTIDTNGECPHKDEIKAILNSIVDDETIKIGMLTKVMELIDTKTTDLLNSGEEKAENVLNKAAEEEVPKED